MADTQRITTIEHTGQLDDVSEMPAYLMPCHDHGHSRSGRYSCSFCGVGDSGVLVPKPGEASTKTLPSEGNGTIRLTVAGEEQNYEADFENNLLVVKAGVALVPPGGVIGCELTLGEQTQKVTIREEESRHEGSKLVAQVFSLFLRSVNVSTSQIKQMVPTGGCIKFKLSIGRQRPAFPIHTMPGELSPEEGSRTALTYKEAISRLADLVIEHQGPHRKVLIYASGQLDYFTIFAMQEVFRLIGIRNLTGNAEHCLNAGAVHNEVLTGQEGPFLTIEQGLEGPDRFYLLNGWNGMVTHPPVFHTLSKRDDLDAYLIEVMVTESARALAAKLGPERIVLIRPCSDPHLALAVAHEILTRHQDAIEQRFIDLFASREAFDAFSQLALSPAYALDQVAARIAPEPHYVERIQAAVRDIAAKLVKPGSVPINLPSVGLSQTTGIVTHCLWGNVLAMIGKYGLKPDGTPAGGTLRVPGQINAESEVQGLSRKYFMGRIPMEESPEAARRMGLPFDAYVPAEEDLPRAALDYSEPTPGDKELFLCFGTQFEANMMGRKRWLRKLEDPDVRLVVIDPIPDPYTLDHADLIIPSPPHVATTKLYQNGEWKLSLSIPQKQAPPETRSDATIIYDLMAEITRRLETDPDVRDALPDLARHAESGYLRRRFMEPEETSSITGPFNRIYSASGLLRVDGEVSRPQLWERIQDYMSGGNGPLYCRPEHEDGRPIRWEELLQHGSLIYGGVGKNRYVLDYDTPDHTPFCDIYRRPGGFRFFMPTEADLTFPEGIILNSGRSALSDERDRVRFATSSFNSGKATPLVGMPEVNPIHISPMLADRLKLKNGNYARITGRVSGDSLVLPVVVTDRVKGETTYVCFHKSRGQLERGHYINDITNHVERCAYSGQTRLKGTQISLTRADVEHEHKPQDTSDALQRATAMLPPTDHVVDPTLIDPRADLPVWGGQGTPVYVTDIIQETHDVYTFRFQGNPLCRFVYWPGEFCSFVLNINGKKVVRSYTISSTPSRPFILEVTVKRVPGGLVSNWLPDNLRIGDQVTLAGPKGKFYLAPGKIPPKILFLSAGSGVTPMMSMARWLCDVGANVDIKFLNSVKTPDDIIYRKEIELLTSRYKIFEPIVVTTTRESRTEWGGLKGRINERMLEMVVPDLHERHVYMCGPEGFMDCAKGILKTLDFDMANLHMESFGGVRTSKKNKAIPSEIGHATTTVSVPGSQEDAAETQFEVTWASSGKTCRSDGDTPLLDLAEEQDIDIDYSCRSGSCGDCKARLVKGTVNMECDDGLEADEKERGYILTCVSSPTSDCILEV